MTITEELAIACPPTTAFDAIADVRNETVWNDDVSAAELITTEPIGQGSQFVTKHGAPLGEISSTITVFDRPTRLEYASTSQRMDLDIAFTFAETDSGTLVNGTFTPKPRGIMAVLFPLLRPMIRRNMAKQHQNLKAFCESRAEQAGS